MDAKDYLLSLSNLRKEIDRKQEQIQQYHEIATQMTSQFGERVQSSGSPHKVENAMVEIVERQKEIEDYIKRLFIRESEIINLLEQMMEEQPTEYEVLYRRYVMLQSFTEITEKMDKSYSTITHAHGKGLITVQKLLEGQNDENNRG